LSLPGLNWRRPSFLHNLEYLVIPETPIDLGADHAVLGLDTDFIEAIEDHLLAVAEAA